MKHVSAVILIGLFLLSLLVWQALPAYTDEAGSSYQIVQTGEIPSQPGVAVGETSGYVSPGEFQSADYGQKIAEYPIVTETAVSLFPTATHTPPSPTASHSTLPPEPTMTPAPPLIPWQGAPQTNTPPTPANHAVAAPLIPLVVDDIPAGYQTPTTPPATPTPDQPVVGTFPAPGDALVVHEAIHGYSPFFSPPRATSAQAVAYIINRGTTLPPEEVTLIVWHYWNLATQVGLDPLLVIAQSIHETDNLNSWWAQSPRRNLAGLLVTGEQRSSTPLPTEMHTWAWQAEREIWWRGFSFPDWETSVRRHIGLLLAYTLRDDQANGLQQALIAEALGNKSFPQSYRGCAAAPVQLNGRWAVPGYTYGQTIANVAERIRRVAAP